MALVDFVIFCLLIFINECSGFLIGISCGISHSRANMAEFLRIRGGTASAAGEWPWQVIIREKGLFECSGVIIDRKWILTVAHCFDTGVSKFSTTKYSVVTGEYTLGVTEGTEVVNNVTRFIPHPKFNAVTGENDIALVELAAAVNYNNNISPICLPSSEQSFSGRNCIVSGWGETRDTGDPNVLRWVSVPVIDAHDCQRKYPKHSHYHIFPTNICAGTPNKDSCGGDSGGPLACRVGTRWEAAGLVSWGEGCGSRYPGVYTRIQSYLAWIEKTVGS